MRFLAHGLLSMCIPLPLVLCEWTAQQDSAPLSLPLPVGLLSSVYVSAHLCLSISVSVSLSGYLCVPIWISCNSLHVLWRQNDRERTMNRLITKVRTISPPTLLAAPTTTCSAQSAQRQRETYVRIDLSISLSTYITAYSCEVTAKVW